jgi:hypothetical protein
MTTASVTFTFPEHSTVPGAQANVNFSDLVGFINAGYLAETYTALSAGDVDGPSGSGLLMLVRDSTNNGTALVMYESGQTPLICFEIVNSGTRFVNYSPGATQIQIKNRTGGIAFRAGSSRNSASLRVTTLIAQS